jgi:cadmium efflux system accessory protein
MPKSEYVCDCNIIHEGAVSDIKESMLPEGKILEISTFFKIIGDPTRTKILFALDKHELCVCDICNVLGMTKSAISHQLATLRKARLVKYRRDGKTVYYSLNDMHVKLIFETAMEHLAHRD